MVKNKTSRYRLGFQLLRYGIIGVASNLIMYLLYLLITYDGIEPKTAMTSLYIIGASISFFANKKITFSYKDDVLGSGIRFTITYLFGYLLNFLILMVFVDKFGYPHQLIQGIAIFVVAGFLFVCLKKFVFRVAHNSKAKVNTKSILTAENTKTRRAWLQRSEKD